MIFLAVLPSAASARSSGSCLECHTARALPASPFQAAEDRSVYHAKLEPCPGLRSVAEETFFTESRIFRLNRILGNLADGPDIQGRTSSRMAGKISESSASLAEIRRSGVNSLAQVARELAAQRSALQKVYDHTLKLRGESDRRFLIGLGGIIFLALLLLLGVGYRKIERMGKAVLFLLLVGGGLAVNGCSLSPAEEEKKSPAQEKVDGAAAAAAKILSSMEESFTQSILLAEVGKEWSKIDPGGAEKAFQLAWQRTLAAREKAGRRHSLEEISARWPDAAAARKEKVNFDTLLDLRDDLRDAQGRTWGLRAIAEEWIQADEKKGRSALEAAAREAQAMKDAGLRDREMKSLAAAWAAVDREQALATARSIRDPFLKAMALAEVSSSSNHLVEAWKAAEGISTGYPRVKAFIQISAAGAQIHPAEKRLWAEKVAARVKELGNLRLRNFAALEMIREWTPVDWQQAERWSAEIGAEPPSARAYAFLYLGSRNAQTPREKALAFLKSASGEARKISDAYEAQKIRFLALRSMAEIEPAEALRLVPLLEDPFFRSELLVQLSRQLAAQDEKSALELAGKIPMEALRTKALVAVVGRWIGSNGENSAALFGDALKAASLIPDPCTRVFAHIEVARSWGRSRRGAESGPLETARKAAAEISSPGLKAHALEALAEAWKGSDPVRGQALRNELDPAVIRSRQSVEEVKLWAKADPLRAGQMAESFPDGFPLEKASVLKEAAGGLKKAQPAMAFDLLGKALAQVENLPGTPRVRQVRSSLGAELALVDKERVLQRVKQVRDREVRDLLLMEAGKGMAKNDPAWAARAAAEISEGSLRLALYRRIGEFEAQGKAAGKDTPSRLALRQWGLGREKGKTEETSSLPFFDQAMREISKVDARERVLMLSGLAAEWAPLDEQKALEAAEKASGDAEAYSFALLAVGRQFGKWNRERAEAVFKKTMAAAESIADASLKRERRMQLAQAWGMIDPAKGDEIRKRGQSGANDPLLNAKILLENAEARSKRGIEQDLKILEKALQFAKSSQDSRLLADVAVAWFACDPEKGLEVLAQAEAGEGRVQALRRMARQIVSSRTPEARRLWDRAAAEALALGDLKEKVKALKEIAADLAGVDRNQARALYLKAYQEFEKSPM